MARNGASSIVYVPLLAKIAKTGKPLDYGVLRRIWKAAKEVRQRLDQAAHHRLYQGTRGLDRRLRWFLLFFATAIVICGLLLLNFTRCWRATLVVVCCSLALLWSGSWVCSPPYTMELDPYSILVPFLIFAIGMSHGSQKMNGVMQDVGRGTHQVVAARYTFSRLFLAGLTALLADAVGFAVLAFIRIQVIQELALAASMGVAILIITNLILVPVLLSYAGVSLKAAERSLKTELAEKTGREKESVVAIPGCLYSQEVGYRGDLRGSGTRRRGLVRRPQPEDRRLGSRGAGASGDLEYNRDNAYLTANYGASSDVLAVMVETPEGQLQSTRPAESAGRAGLEAAGRRGSGVDTLAGADDPAVRYRLQRRQCEVVRTATQPGNAEHDYGQNPARVIQRSLLAADLIGVPQGPQGGHADACGEHGGRVWREEQQ